MNLNVHPTDICYLCGKKGGLQLSHIEPRFMYDWLKKTSGTGFIRRGNAPNLRVQDGLKRYLLCNQCEQLFSKWENRFSNEIFLPLHEDRAQENIEYGPWLAKFAVSLSWRVLVHFKVEGLISDFPEHIISSVDDAIWTWKNFLLDKCPHPGRFEQHMLPVGPIVRIKETTELPLNLNRYLLRSVHPDVTYGKSVALVFIKLCGILFVGFIRMPNPKEWEGTKLNIKHGIFQTKNARYTVPEYLGRFLFESAREIYDAGKGISDHQKKRIDETIQKDLVRYSESESFDAIMYDRFLFGDPAFGYSNKGKVKKER